MEFDIFANGFCPILSAGLRKPTSCQKNCQWHNPNTNQCDVSAIASALLNDPDLIEIKHQNEVSQ